MLKHSESKYILARDLEWEALYRNGILIAEGSRLTIKDIFKVLFFDFRIKPADLGAFARYTPSGDLKYRAPHRIEALKGAFDSAYTPVSSR